MLTLHRSDVYLYNKSMSARLSKFGYSLNLLRIKDG